MMSTSLSGSVAIQGMYTPKTFPEWYFYEDGERSVALLTSSGDVAPQHRGTAVETLATLAAAIHAASGLLSERDLRQAEQFLAMHRWRVPS